VTIGTW